MKISSDNNFYWPIDVCNSVVCLQDCLSVTLAYGDDKHIDDNDGVHLLSDKSPQTGCIGGIRRCKNYPWDQMRGECCSMNCSYWHYVSWTCEGRNLNLDHWDQMRGECCSMNCSYWHNVSWTYEGRNLNMDPWDQMRGECCSMNCSYWHNVSWT